MTWACVPVMGTSPRFAAGDLGQALRERGRRSCHRARVVSGRGEPGKRGPRSAEGGRASALRRAHRDSADRGVGWAGGALAQRSGPRAGWKGEGIGLDPGEGKWAGELLGPRGKKRRGAGLGCFWSLGWLGFLVPSLF